MKELLSGLGYPGCYQHLNDTTQKSAFVQRVNSIVFLPITVHKFIYVMNTVLSDVTPCYLPADTNISKKPVITTLRVE
jgi:hypothetical protein